MIIYVARGANQVQLPKMHEVRKAIVICLIRAFYSPFTRYNLRLSVQVQGNVHHFTTSVHINCCVLMPANTEINIDVHIDEHQNSLILNTISKLERLQPEYTPPFEVPDNTHSQMRSASGSDKILPPPQVMLSEHQTRCAAIFLTSAILSHNLNYIAWQMN